MRPARILATIAGGIIAGAATWIIGMRVACEHLWPTSNLCGLPVALIALPLGIAAGAALAWRGTRR